MNSNFIERFNTIYYRLIESQNLSFTYKYIEEVGELFASNHDLKQKIMVEDRNNFFIKISHLLQELDLLILMELKPIVIKLESLYPECKRMPYIDMVVRYVNGETGRINDEINTQTTILYQLSEAFKKVSIIVRTPLETSEYKVSKLLFDEVFDQQTRFANTKFGKIYSEIKKERFNIKQNIETEIWYGFGLIYYYHQIQSNSLNEVEFKEYFYPALTDSTIVFNLKNELTYPPHNIFESQRTYFKTY